MTNSNDSFGQGTTLAQLGDWSEKIVEIKGTLVFIANVHMFDWRLAFSKNFIRMLWLHFYNIAIQSWIANYIVILNEHFNSSQIQCT